jgi:methionyl aminopeptidase
MTIETERDIDGLKRVGRVVAVVLHEMLDSIEAGMTTAELDCIGRTLLDRHGARSAPQVTYNFPGATCISVNEEAAHGIPGSRVIRPGDVVNVDVSAELDAYFADTSGTRVVPRRRRSRIDCAVRRSSLCGKP